MGLPFFNKLKSENKDLKIRIYELERSLAQYKAQDGPNEKEELEAIKNSLPFKRTTKQNTPTYDVFTGLNKEGLIIKTVGPDQLKDICADFIDLLETSAAVFELNGDYALRLISSGWYGLMNEASRKLHNDDNKQEPNENAAWLCHESYWKDVALQCIKKREPVDLKCPGGMGLYAVPVIVNDEVPGAISFAYGNPPNNDAELKKLSEEFHIPLKKLNKQATAYQRRPSFIIELAKERAKESAAKIAYVIEINQINEQLKERIKELKCLYTIANISETSGISIDAFLQKSVAFIPNAWQYPEVSHARIKLGKKVYVSANFRESKWKQEADININDNKHGSLEVFYSEQKPAEAEGPFLQQERTLIDTLARNISLYVTRKKAEIEKDESEEHLQITLNSIGDAVISTDVDGHVKQLNPVAQKLTGYSCEAAKGEHIDRIFNIYNTQTGEKVENPVKKVLEIGEMVGLANHTKLISSQGEVYQIADSGSPIKNSDGEIVGVVLVFRDVTEEYSMIEKLKESEQKYRTIFENTGTATSIIEKDGTISLANRMFAKLAGYSLKEIEHKKTWMDFVVPEDLARMREQHELRRKNQQEALTEYEFQFIDKKNRRRNLFLTVEMIPGTDKSVASLLDNTEQKEAEAKLEKSREQYRLIVENQTDLVIKIDSEWRFSFVSPSYCKLFGKDRDELLGKYFMSPGHEEDRDSVIQAMEKIYTPPNKVYFEEKALTPGGEVWIAWNYSAIKNKSDNITEVIGIGRDITEQKKAEVAIHENRRRLNTLLDNLPGMAYRCKNDKYWTMEFLSSGCKDLTGYDTDEMLHNAKVAYADLIHPNDKEMVYEKTQEAVNLAQPFVIEYRIKDKNGREKWVWEQGREIHYDSEAVGFIEGIVMDVTERKIAQQDLEHSHNLMRYIIEHSNNSVAVHDKNLNYIYVSQRYIEEYNLQGKPVIGRQFYDVIPYIPQKWKEVHQRALAGEVLSANRDVFIKPDDETAYTRWECRPWYNKAGAVGGIIVYTENITDLVKKEIDLQQNSERLERAENSAELGSWEYNIENKENWWSKQMYRMLGFDQTDNVPSYEDILKHIHPDEQPSIKKALEQILKGEMPSAVEFRSNPHYGPIRIFAVTTNAVEDENGNIIKITGTILNITERKKAEEELRSLKENLENEVQEKTKEMKERVKQLERFQEATIEREFRIKELRNELEQLKSK